MSQFIVYIINADVSFSVRMFHMYIRANINYIPGTFITVHVKTQDVSLVFQLFHFAILKEMVGDMLLYIIRTATYKHII